MMYSEIRHTFSEGEQKLIDSIINYQGKGFGLILGVNDNKDETFTGWVMTFSGSQSRRGIISDTPNSAMINVVSQYARTGFN